MMPITSNGRICASIAVLVGIIVLVLPLSIIQFSCVDERRKTQSRVRDAESARQIRAMIEASHMNKDGTPLLSPMAASTKRTPRAARFVDEQPGSTVGETMLLPALIGLAHQLNISGPTPAPIHKLSLALRRHHSTRLESQGRECVGANNEPQEAAFASTQRDTE